MRSTGTPTSSCQISSASSSLTWTVTQMRSASSPSTSVTNSHAQRDGLGLEVVAEAEVAEHLEEAEVAGGAADVVEVVVLAAGPRRTSAPSRRAWYGRLLLAEEVRHELHHPRDGEQRPSGGAGSGWPTARACGRRSAKKPVKARRSSFAVRASAWSDQPTGAVRGRPGGFERQSPLCVGLALDQSGTDRRVDRGIGRSGCV